MNDTIKVFGHITPDTDTVVSAIAYAWYLNEIKNTPAQAYILGGLNKETQYVLDVFSVTTPATLDNLTSEDKIVIVDTNNPDELPTNMKDAEIIEIIDHHKLTGGITTATPLSITMRPMASTASLIYTIINPELYDIPKEIAGLLLSGILSDTLKFRSPTTTPEDKTIAQELAKIAEVNIDAHSKNMFDAKSDISDLTAEEIILMDSKVFTIKDNKKVRLSVLETTSPNNALAIINELKTAIKTITEREGLNGVLFFVVDILNENSTLIVASNEMKNLATTSYNVEFTNQTVLLKGMISRKKQLLPPLID